MPRTRSSDRDTRTGDTATAAGRGARLADRERRAGSDQAPEPRLELIGGERRFDPAVEGDRDPARFLRDDHRNGVVLLGQPDGGTVARAHTARKLRIDRERQK